MREYLISIKPPAHITSHSHGHHKGHMKTLTYILYYRQRNFKDEPARSKKKLL